MTRPPPNPKKRPRDLDEPGVLDRVVEAVAELEDRPAAFARIDLGRQRLVTHAAGVRELGVVVVTQEVIEAAGGRASRVDVRMRVERSGCLAISPVSNECVNESSVIGCSLLEN